MRKNHMKVKIRKLRDQDSNCCLPLGPLYNNICNITKLTFRYRHTLTYKNTMPVIMQNTHAKSNLKKNEINLLNHFTQGKLSQSIGHANIVQTQSNQTWFIIQILQNQYQYRPELDDPQPNFHVQTDHDSLYNVN